MTVCALDPWLRLPAERLRKRLVGTGSMVRAAVHDAFGRPFTKGLDREWSASEQAIVIAVTSLAPRAALLEFDDLLGPLVASGRVVAEVVVGGRWRALNDALYPSGQPARSLRHALG
ncbi:hypothetical protein [Craurococcus roseus]|uniref:hypothetical protein n=1 Tax=Craurococcus roseus TaxID=77585 RepID=UPI0031D9A493